MKVAEKITKQTRIGVLYGGLSNEREVSLRSGKNCFNALKRLGYENAVLIDVGENLSEEELRLNYDHLMNYLNI